MDLKQLQYFVAAADEGSITAAAKRLYMSQPPLSVQIKNLEQEMGCLLFSRGSRRLQLTDSGKTLYNYAVKLLDISRIAKEDVQYTAQKSKGVIRIGIVSSLVCSKALDWIKAFLETNQMQKFEITEGNTYELLEMLHNKTIHTALVRSPYNHDKIESIHLVSDTLVAVGNRSFFKESDSTSLDEISKFPIILYRRWKKIIDSMFFDVNIKYECRFTNDDARTTIRLAEMGLGIALVPQSAVASITSPDTEYRFIHGCNVISDIEAVTAENEVLPVPVQSFLDFLKALPKDALK